MEKFSLPAKVIDPKTGKTWYSVGYRPMTFTQWRRDIEAKYPPQGLCFSLMDRNGKTTHAKAFYQQQEVGSWPE